MEESIRLSRAAIYDAALAELLDRGIDNYTIDGIAKRASLDRSTIIQIWGDARVLLMEAQLSRASETVPATNTGSLHGDLLEYAASLTELAATTEGRGWFQRLLPAGRDVDFAEVRADFWKIRFDSVEPILERAAERGELRDGIDAMAAIRMFSAALYFDVIFADTAVDPDYAAQVLDIFIHGITQ